MHQQIEAVPTAATAAMGIKGVGLASLKPWDAKEQLFLPVWQLHTWAAVWGGF